MRAHRQSAAWYPGGDNHTNAIFYSCHRGRIECSLQEGWAFWRRFLPSLPGGFGGLGDGCVGLVGPRRAIGAGSHLWVQERCGEEWKPTFLPPNPKLPFYTPFYSFCFSSRNYCCLLGVWLVVQALGKIKMILGLTLMAATGAPLGRPGCEWTGPSGHSYDFTWVQPPFLARWRNGMCIGSAGYLANETPFRPPPG